MRTFLIAAALLAFPAAPRAQLELGARLGYARAAGDAAQGQKLSDLVESQVPVQLDAAWRVTPELAVGAYLSYGFAQLASQACPSPLDCTARDLRVGLQATYTLARLGTALVPWVGLGAGWERASYEANASIPFGPSFHGEARFSGWEYLNVQLGGDWRASEKLWLGPYAMVSLAKFSETKTDNDFDPTLNFDGSIPDQRMHQWWSVGVRGKLDL